MPPNCDRREGFSDVEGEDDGLQSCAVVRLHALACDGGRDLALIRIRPHLPRAGVSWSRST